MSMKNNLCELGADGYLQLIVPLYKYQPLDLESKTQRFLVLHPPETLNKNSFDDPVRCHFLVQDLDTAPPFIAIKHSRGYRLLETVIDVQGSALKVTAAQVAFLRQFRDYGRPIVLWDRTCCLNRYDINEIKRYWNREFVDSMYEKAAGVVDMAAINADLLDQGIIETQYDPDHDTWVKVWDKVPKAAKLPEVIPIQLGRGSFLSDDSPTMDYAYVPLDAVANEIRLLRISPSKDPSSTLITHLAHCPIRHEFAYSALSYTWGTELATTMIVVSGQRMMIRPNLEKALRSFRRENKVLVVWVDAICINQADTCERNRQLPRIAEIYEAAVSVVAYTGERDEYCDVALDFMRHLQEPMMMCNSEGEWAIGKKEKIGPDKYPGMCAALYKFLTQPYFRRIWVIQEIALSSNPAVACGERYDTHFSVLDTATYNLIRMMSRDIYLAQRMEESMPSLVIDTDKLLYCRKLFYFRHILSRGAETWWASRHEIRPKTPGFLETLVLSRNFEATVGHDKLFALWNVASDKEGLDFTMDYFKALPATYTDFVIAWATQHRTLDMIAVSEPNIGSEGFYEAAPSWVPDWTMSARMSSLVCKDYVRDFIMSYSSDMDGLLYSTDSNVTNEVDANTYFSFEGQTLQCTGIIIDQISRILPDPGVIPVGVPFYPTIHGHTFWRFHEWKDQVEDYYTEHKEVLTYTDPLQATVAMFHGDVPSTWSPAERHPQYPLNGHKYIQRLFEQYVCSPKQSRHITVYADSYDREKAWDVAQMVLRGRAPGITESGYMGLFPDFMRNNPRGKPYLVAILATCSVPVILQELDDGTYKLCGSCFIQGLMEGEYIRDTDVDTVKAFWDAVQGAGKLSLV